ncbi:MAG: divalent-cation tolerance protein CutA [Vicinamibacterales bacterium]
MEMAEFAVVLTTLPLDSDAGALAESLVGERLAACVNILPPMESIYRWKGGVEKGSERQLVIKTTANRVAALQQRLRELHPYDVPEMLVLPVSTGSDAYLAWLRESCE